MPSNPTASASPEVETVILSLSEEIRRFSASSVNGLEKLTAFQNLIAEYLSGNDPPIFALAKSMGCDFSYNEVIRSTQNLILRLEILRSRFDASTVPGYGIEWDRMWEKTQHEWKNKRAQLTELLIEAADLFDSGQCDPGPYSSLTGYMELEIEKYKPVDEALWCGSENLRRWAKLVATSPVEAVFPVARPQPSGFPFHPENIGKRGGASDSKGAMRAMIVREIAKHVPVTMKSRYSTIAALAQHIGMSVDAHYVRSLLMKGQT